MNLIPGQTIFIQSSSLKTTLTVENDSIELEHSVFLLNSNGKVSKDVDFVFFNNTVAFGVVHDPDNGITDIDLNKVEADKIVLALTIDQQFKQAGSVKLLVQDKETGIELAVFELDTSDKEETALIIGVIYRRDDSWKLRAVGQGFNGGLQPLAELYGVDAGKVEAVHEKMVVQPPKDIKQIDNGPIDLNKSGEKTTISLDEDSNVFAKLKWDNDADLDLYCFYVTDSGIEDKVYYRKLGSPEKSPYIHLLGDKKVAGEEIIEITKPDNVHYALIAAYSAVSNGFGSFKSYNARCVITDNKDQKVTTYLDYDDPCSYWVALALIDFTIKTEVTIKNVETYANKENFAKDFELRTNSPLADFFKKNICSVNGVTGYHPERAPYLFKDGSFMMSAGVIEFK